MSLCYVVPEIALPKMATTVPKIELSYSGGDRGAGDREKRGREVYGRREKRGREAGFPRWREAGEKGKNYATLRNISQSKNGKGGSQKIQGGNRD